MSRETPAEIRRAPRSGANRLSRAAVAVAAIAMLLAGCGDDGGSSTNDDAPREVAPTAAPTTTADPSKVTPCPAADGSSKKALRFQAPPPVCIDAAKTYTATIETNKGTFTVTFDQKRAPIAVNNFVYLARYHYYDGVTFHRIVPDFVIQGGDPEGTGAGGPGYTFADELPQAGEYKVGSLAMANAGPNTNGSQFFVITGPRGVALDPNYSLFGQVTAGQSVVDAIGKLGDANERPTETITMTKVTIAES